MPFKRFEDMGFMHHSKYLGTIKLDRQIMKTLTEEDLADLRTYCNEALKRYFSD